MGCRLALTAKRKLTSGLDFLVVLEFKSGNRRPSCCGFLSTNTISMQTRSVWCVVKLSPAVASDLFCGPGFNYRPPPFTASHLTRWSFSSTVEIYGLRAYSDQRQPRPYETKTTLSSRADADAWS